MAKASARSKAAASGSSPISGGPGITTHEISELRGLFLASPTPSHTSQSPIPPSFVYSQRGNPGRRLEPSSGSADLTAKTEITIKMPNGDMLEIVSDQVTIEFSRNFVDVTRWTSSTKTYMVDKGTFTIKGKL
jgi:hypothetical protein